MNFKIIRHLHFSKIAKRKSSKIYLIVFPGGTSGKEPPAKRDAVGSLDWEDPLKEGMATHSSILGWRIPWTEEPGGQTVHRVPKSQTQLKQFSTACMPCNRDYQLSVSPYSFPAVFPCGSPGKELPAMQETPV